MAIASQSGAYRGDLESQPRVLYGVADEGHDISGNFISRQSVELTRPVASFTFGGNSIGLASSALPHSIFGTSLLPSKKGGTFPVPPCQIAAKNEDARLHDTRRQSAFGPISMRGVEANTAAAGF